MLEHPVKIIGFESPPIFRLETLRKELVQVENMGSPPRTFRIINLEQVRLHFGKWGRDFDLVVHPVWHSKKSKRIKSECFVCTSAPSSHPALPEGVKNPFATARSAVLDAKGAGYNAGNDETPKLLMRGCSPRRSGRRSDDWCPRRDSNPDADGCGF